MLTGPYLDLLKCLVKLRCNISYMYFKIAQKKLSWFFTYLFLAFCKDLANKNKSTTQSSQKPRILRMYISVGRLCIADCA